MTSHKRLLSTGPTLFFHIRKCHWNGVRIALCKAGHAEDRGYVTGSNRQVSEDPMTFDPTYSDPNIGTGIELDTVLPSMERRAQNALLPDERARIINLAGDLCFDAGSREQALAYYDRAIDTYLSVGLYASAVAVCQKIVRLTPEVIRARCTLAWLAIARGMLNEARDRIQEYADAAGRLQDSRLAWGHLRMMAEVCESQEVLQSVADALLQLGDVRGADKVYGAAFGGELSMRKLPVDPQSRWGVVLERIMTAQSN